MPASRKLSASKTADALWGLIVRSAGACCICGETFALQAMHGFSRRYRATRWDRRNGFPGCRSHHMYFTHHPLEWDEWLIATWGSHLYHEMRQLALYGPTPDPRDIVAELRPIWNQISEAA